MIINFVCERTEAIWNGQRSKHLPPDIQNLARRKLRYLNNARTLGDLRVPPGNHLEMLSGKRKGTCSIRINDQWRICFCFRDGDAYDVEIVDYH